MTKEKYIELIKYAFWGCFSTAINLGILFVLITFTDIHYIIANSFAYFISSIADNFITNLINVGNFELGISIDIKVVLVIILIFVLVYIFKYGAVLQRESDETL